MAKWAKTVKIGGETYVKEGPYYCPAGTGWNLLDKIVGDMRKKGMSVRVKKYPASKNPALKGTGNTHEVWLLVRRRK